MRCIQAMARQRTEQGAPIASTVCASMFGSDVPAGQYMLHKLRSMVIVARRQVYLLVRILCCICHGAWLCALGPGMCASKKDLHNKEPSSPQRLTSP